MINDAFFKSSETLEMLQRAINIWSEGKIKTIISSNSTAFTDGKVVAVTFHDEWIEQLPEEMQLKAGLRHMFAQVAHELGHVFWSDFSFLDKLTAFQKHVFNIIEDAAIENGLSYCKWPGLGRFVQWRKNELFQLSQEPDHDQAKINVVMTFFANQVMLGTSKGDPALYLSEEELDVFQKVMELAIKARELPKCKDRLDAALEIAEIIQATFTTKEFSQSSSSFPNENQQNNQEDSEEKEDIPQKTAEENSEQGNEPDTEQPGNEPEKEEASEERTGMNSGDELDPSDTEATEEAVAEEEEFLEDFIKKVEKEMKMRTESVPVSQAPTSWGIHQGIHCNLIEIKSRNITEYNRVVESKKGLIVSTSKDLKNSIRQQRDEWMNVNTGAKLNLKQVARGQRKELFAKALDFSDDLDVAVTLLLDMSGSMWGSRIQFAKEAAVVLAECFRRAEIPISIIGHSAPDGRSAINLALYKPFRKNYLSDYANVTRVSEDADGCNRDGCALRWVHDYITQNSPSEQNILVVLSDGSPNHLDAFGTRYNSTADVRYQSTALSKESNIQVIGVGLDDDGIKSVKECYKEHLLVKDVGTLTRKMVNLMKSYFPAQ